MHHWFKCLLIGGEWRDELSGRGSGCGLIVGSIQTSVIRIVSHGSSRWTRRTRYAISSSSGKTVVSTLSRHPWGPKARTTGLRPDVLRVRLLRQYKRDVLTGPRGPPKPPRPGRSPGMKGPCVLSKHQTVFSKDSRGAFPFAQGTCPCHPCLPWVQAEGNLGESYDQLRIQRPEADILGSRDRIPLSSDSRHRWSRHLGDTRRRGQVAELVHPGVPRSN